MSIVTKLTDALSMFWQALDEDERRIVMYAGVYLAVTFAIGVQGLTNERRETRIRRQVIAELKGDSAAA